MVYYFPSAEGPDCHKIYCRQRSAARRLLKQQQVASKKHTERIGSISSSLQRKKITPRNSDFIRQLFENGVKNSSSLLYDWFSKSRKSLRFSTLPNFLGLLARRFSILFSIEIIYARTSGIRKLLFGDAYRRGLGK